MIVKLVDGLSAREQADVISRNGGVETSSIPALRLHVIKVWTTDLSTTIANYQADPLVEHVEINQTRQVEGTPSDLFFPEQWALPNIEWDSVFGAFTPLGSATVAVLDTGVDASHPDLTGRIVPGTSILDGSNGMTDPHGHGTWLSGIIAALTDNGTGIAGIGFWGVQIMPVTVLGADGAGQDSDVIAGVIWAADHSADVILMGFSDPGMSQNLQDAIDYAWSKGAVLVAATGNDGVSTPTFPAGDRGVIGVSATDLTNSLVPTSNYGQDVFLAAPGTAIYTTDLNGNYTVLSGTSGSAAIVAGVAAFMKANEPTLTNGIIVGRLARTADPAGTQEQTGNGRINMARAMDDTSIDPVQPAGTSPFGNGGPFVGPYLASGGSHEGGGGDDHNEDQLYTLTLNIAGPGFGTVSGAGEYPPGTIVPVSATADPGSHFIGWTGPDAPECATGSILMDWNESCTAYFELNASTYTLTITPAGTGSGTVTATPGAINCGATCSDTFNENTVVTLMATADPGSTFTGWSGDPDCTDGSVTMTASKSCTATFDAAPASADLSITKTDSPDPVTAGTNLTYTITVTNNGPDAATGVTVTDTLPAGVIFVSAGGTGWACNESSGVVTCTRAASLAVGAAPAITIVVTPTAAGTITNSASVSGTETDPVPGNNTAGPVGTTVLPAGGGGGGGLIGGHVISMAGESLSSTTYQIIGGTGGQGPTGSASSATYQLDAGFAPGVIGG